jgi:predicted Rossmann-fold nucleotide-binding protein
MEGMSIPDMYERLRIAAENKQEELRRDGERRNVDLRIRDYANTSFMPLMPDQNGERVVYSFSGVTLDSMTFHPRPASDPYRYSEHYLIPGHESVQNGCTKAEIEGYIPEQSCMALACRAMARVTGINKHKHALKSQFRQAGNPRTMRIATQHSIMPATFGHDVNELQRAFHPDGRYKSGHTEFQFIHGKQGDFDITEPAEHTVPVKGGGTRTFYSALNNVHNLMRKADGFLLTPENSARNEERYFWQRLYFSLSATVGKQTFDRALANKPFAIFNPEDERNCRDYECVYNSLHKKGFIGEKPGHIYKAPKARNKLVKKLCEAAASYVPPHIPAYDYEESGDPQPEGMDRITVYASAKFNNEEMDAMARYIGYEAAANGFALKNGGGKDGLMLQTSLGFHEFRNNDHDDPRHPHVTKTHIASIQCAETRQMEGLCDFNDLMKVYPSIHLRIEDLADAETEIVLPGGAGTWQEIAGSAILRRLGLKDPVNQPLIIVDPELGHGKHRTRPYQQIIDMIPEQDFATLNINVVETGRQAMKLAIQARDARRRAMAYECRAANSNDRVGPAHMPRPA